VTAEQIAANLAQQFEGFSSTPYQDPSGIWTIGYGSTYDPMGNHITENTPIISQDEALIWLENTMRSAFYVITEYVKVTISDNQKAALADFIYNIGVGNFVNSTLLKILNEGDYSGAGRQLLVWDISDGEVLPGLLRRRQAELGLFNT